MGKFICRMSFILPYVFLYILIDTPTALSIREIGLSLGYMKTLLLAVVIIVVWNRCSRIKKSCCNGTWTEILFHLVPAVIMGLLIFAQKYFAAVILMLLVLLAAAVALAVLLKNDENKYPYSDRRHHRYARIYRRCAVVLVVIPCSILFAVLALVDELGYRASEETWIRMSSDIGEMGEDGAGLTGDIYQDHVVLLKCFESSRWEGYNTEERITAIQKLADFEAERMGIPPVPVTSISLDENVLGQYRDELDAIQIDRGHMMESDNRSCIITLTHEMYHAMQHYVMKNVDMQSKVVNSMYFDELRSWWDNDRDYKNATVEGYEAYVNQPLEASANRYAEEETEKILSYIG